MVPGPWLKGREKAVGRQGRTSGCRGLQVVDAARGRGLRC